MTPRITPAESNENYQKIILANELLVNGLDLHPSDTDSREIIALKNLQKVISGELKHFEKKEGNEIDMENIRDTLEISKSILNKNSQTIHFSGSPDKLSSAFDLLNSMEEILDGTYQPKEEKTTLPKEKKTSIEEKDFRDISKHNIQYIPALFRKDLSFYSIDDKIHQRSPSPIASGKDGAVFKLARSNLVVKVGNPEKMLGNNFSILPEKIQKRHRLFNQSRYVQAYAGIVMTDYIEKNIKTMTPIEILTMIKGAYKELKIFHDENVLHNDITRNQILYDEKSKTVTLIDSENASTIYKTAPSRINEMQKMAEMVREIYEMLAENDPEQFEPIASCLGKILSDTGDFDEDSDEENVSPKSIKPDTTNFQEKLETCANVIQYIDQFILELNKENQQQNSITPIK